MLQHKVHRRFRGVLTGLKFVVGGDGPATTFDVHVVTTIVGLGSRVRVRVRVSDALKFGVGGDGTPSMYMP